MAPCFADLFKKIHNQTFSCALKIPSHLFELRKQKVRGVFEKTSEKTSLHSFAQGVYKCTPIFEVYPKNFLRKFFPSTCSHLEVSNYRVFLKFFIWQK